MPRWARQVTVIALLALAPAGRAEVVGYTTTTADGVVTLTSVTVRRGGETAIFDPAKLIRVTVLHFRGATPINLVTPAEAGAPGPGRRAALLRDLRLNTGLINPGGQPKPLTRDPILDGAEATPGVAVRFDQPVVNLPGDDVVLFELHRRLGSPVGGDAFHVSPLHFRQGLRSLTIQRFDVHLDHPGVQPLIGFHSYRLARTPRSLGDLETLSVSLANRSEPNDFKALAVAIDLADLGYPAGAKVEGLFFQDCDGTGLTFDPVLIAGLPSPAPPNVLAKAPPVIRPRPPRAVTLQEHLDGPLADVEDIVFAARVGGFDHWYANFGHYSAPQTEYPSQRRYRPGPPLFRGGGRLCRLDIRSGEVKTLLDDPKGGVRDPQVHYGGRRILFSYRKGGTDTYHLYEVDADGSRLRPLTDGPWDDIEP
ncbi:MAG: TolB family protein, partial [Planctomycetota bacterium]